MAWIKGGLGGKEKCIIQRQQENKPQVSHLLLSDIKALWRLGHFA